MVLKEYISITNNTIKKYYSVSGNEFGSIFRPSSVIIAEKSYETIIYITSILPKFTLCMNLSDISFQKKTAAIINVNHPDTQKRYHILYK